MSIIEINEIIKLLPHRYPFLFVDRILKYQKNSNIVAIKNVSYNEFCLSSHFYKNPIFPGVLIVESIAQAACILAYKSLDLSYKNTFFYLTNINSVKFKKKVIPGDQMIIDVIFDKRYQNVIRFLGNVSVNCCIVCKATISCILVNK